MSDNSSVDTLKQTQNSQKSIGEDVNQDKDSKIKQLFQKKNFLQDIAFKQTNFLTEAQGKLRKDEELNQNILKTQEKVFNATLHLDHKIEVCLKKREQQMMHSFKQIMQLCQREMSSLKNKLQAQNAAAQKDELVNQISSNLEIVQAEFYRFLELSQSQQMQIEKQLQFMSITLGDQQI